jgi:hypothetical protein
MSLDSASIFPLVHVDVVWCYETQCMNVDNLQLLIAINGTHAHRCLNSTLDVISCAKFLSTQSGINVRNIPETEYPGPSHPETGVAASLINDQSFIQSLPCDHQHMSSMPRRIYVGHIGAGEWGVVTRGVIREPLPSVKRDKPASSWNYAAVRGQQALVNTVASLSSG